MRVVEVDNTAMICQSPGGFNPNGEMSGGNEEEDVKGMLLPFNIR